MNRTKNGNRSILGVIHDPTAHIEYLETALQVFRSAQGNPSVRDVCKSIYDHLEPIMQINRLFCTEKADSGYIRFLALVEEGDHAHNPPKRRLNATGPILRVLNQGNILSSRDYQSPQGQWGTELQESENWVLIPLTSPSGEVAGVFGACNNQSRSFLAEEINLLDTIAQAVMAVRAKTSVINAIITRERERFMDEAAGVLLHNIVNMLGTIPTYVDAIEQDADLLSPRSRERLQRIKLHATEVQEDCENKLKEIKDRIDQPPPMPTDVINLLNLARTASEANATDVRFRSDFDHSVPRVLVRSQELFDVLKEMIRNGLRAMRDSDEKILTLRAKPWEATPNDRLWVAIEIEDTGCGIPESDLEKIWGLNYSTKSSLGGYGLYCAKSVVEHLGGTISVQSQSGTGTTFTIKLPGID